jgi:hypothetical protein
MRGRIVGDQIRVDYKECAYDLNTICDVTDAPDEYQYTFEFDNELFGIKQTEIKTSSFDKSILGILTVDISKLTSNSSVFKLGWND